MISFLHQSGFRFGKNPFLALTEEIQKCEKMKEKRAFDERRRTSDSYNTDSPSAPLDFQKKFVERRLRLLGFVDDPNADLFTKEEEA